MNVWNLGVNIIGYCEKIHMNMCLNPEIYREISDLIYKLKCFMNSIEEREVSQC
jgi:hypothetical protein